MYNFKLMEHSPTLVWSSYKVPNASGRFTFYKSGDKGVELSMHCNLCLCNILQIFVTIANIVFQKVIRSYTGLNKRKCSHCIKRKCNHCIFA